LRVIWHFHPPAEPDLASELMFWDRRGLGTLSLLTPNQYAGLQQRLGPDALSMTTADWQVRLAKTSRPIKVALPRSNYFGWDRKSLRQ
jgi:hypothetical protein